MDLRLKVFLVWTAIEVCGVLVMLVWFEKRESLHAKRGYLLLNGRRYEYKSNRRTRWLWW